ncbi:C-type lectin domain family 12 member A-like isoform X2 [Macrobrachium nipponense]|uniref:C-type lectin domain family 12 member A-like isoform X2 n=1 Tax=Macrobrachium nipponense TaxID=159736 RepID=UPI0030C8CFD9
MECSRMAVASRFRVHATILLLAMAGRCSSQQMDHIQLTLIANSMDNISRVLQAQTVASERVMEKFTSMATAQAVASEKVAAGIMKIFTLMATDHFVCEKGWMKLRSSCYFMSEDNSTWEKSRQKCIDLNSDLVKITDDDEYNFLRKLSKDTNYYIGLSDMEEEGTYRWVVDGTIHQIVESWYICEKPAHLAWNLLSVPDGETPTEK